MPAGMPFSHRTESGDFMEQLQTRRLLIRPFRPEAAPALQEIFGDGPTMEYIEPPFTQEQTTEFLESFCIGRQGAVAAVLPDSASDPETVEKILANPAGIVVCEGHLSLQLIQCHDFI